jgi:hypothetical protein
MKLWDRPRIIEFAITSVFVSVFLRAFARYCENVIERRPGVVLPDPILARLPVIDFTWATFAVLYVSIFLALGLLARRPIRLTAGLQAYTLMIAFRWFGMYLVPLDPPPGMVALDDPFITFFASVTLTRDLFFSGHTGTMCLLTLTATTKTTRILFAAATVAVASFILFQRVHYTFDVFAAPAFSLLAWRCVHLLRRWLGLPNGKMDVAS